MQLALSLRVEAFGSRMSGCDNIEENQFWSSVGTAALTLKMQPSQAESFQHWSAAVPMMPVCFSLCLALISRMHIHIWICVFVSKEIEIQHVACFGSRTWSCYSNIPCCLALCEHRSRILNQKAPKAEHPKTKRSDCINPQLKAECSPGNADLLSPCGLRNDRQSRGSAQCRGPRDW